MPKTASASVSAEMWAMPQSSRVMVTWAASVFQRADSLLSFWAATGSADSAARRSAGKRGNLMGERFYRRPRECGLRCTHPVAQEQHPSDKGGAPILFGGFDVPQDGVMVFAVAGERLAVWAESDATDIIVMFGEGLNEGAIRHLEDADGSAHSGGVLTEKVLRKFAQFAMVAASRGEIFAVWAERYGVSMVW